MKIVLLPNELQKQFFDAEEGLRAISEVCCPSSVSDFEMFILSFFITDFVWIYSDERNSKSRSPVCDSRLCTTKRQDPATVTVDGGRGAGRGVRYADTTGASLHVCTMGTPELLMSQCSLSRQTPTAVPRAPL
ncbi:hypothetical protein J6590_006669 [Homalodisca vitripennis]|nr:hypothetical protein J6590_006669 [Homalodisca vitripennis]